MNIHKRFLFLEQINSCMDKSVRVFPLNQFNYPKFRGEIIELYLNAFTKGEYAQHIPRESAERTLDEMLRDGSGQMAFANDKLAGVLIALPLSRDKEFPRDVCPQIPVATSVYISEVMTNPDFRGKGVATQLINVFLQEAKEVYTHAVIRVWDENKPALSLYQKMGFTKIGTITQTKFRTENQPFEMNKIYLYKEIR